mgnify:FL=1
MASSSEVYAALRVIGASCKGMGSGENWAMDVASTWAEELTHSTAKHVMEAARLWIRTEERRPSLVNFMNVVKQAKGRAYVKEGADGCADCGESGWREIVVHWMDLRSKTRRCHSYTSPCECDKGLHYGTSVDGFTFSKAIRQFEQQPGFIELHCTDKDRLRIPLALRVAPGQYQQMQNSPRRRSLKWSDK